MDMQERLKSLMNVLLSVIPDVYHYTAIQKMDKYIVWAEDSGGQVHASDNQIIDQAIVGTIDYFTKSEFDLNVDLIDRSLSNAKIAYKLNSIQHEEETGYIHYEWLFEV